MVSAPELGLAWVAGSLTTLNPCVFPLLPLVLGGAVQENRLAPVAMGAGMVAAFAALGLLVGVAGDAFGLNPDHIRVTGALLLIGFGLVMLVPWLNVRFTAWMAPMATGADSATRRFNAGSMTGAFAIGGLLGMVWSPCSGPMLASALTIVATEGGALRGTVVLGVFGLGAATVLVAAAYASRAGFGRVRGWVLTHMDRVKRGFGILVLLLGLAILMGGDKWLETQLIRVMPQGWIDLTTRF
jgi:cytochrome c-type biogenesis protein